MTTKKTEAERQRIRFVDEDEGDATVSVDFDVSLFCALLHT